MGWGGWGGEYKIVPFHNEKEISDIASINSAAFGMWILYPCSDVAEIMDFVKNSMLYEMICCLWITHECDLGVLHVVFSIY